MVERLYKLFKEVGGLVSTDSRKASGIFFALKGEKFDGNLFAAQALQSGAKYAVVDDPKVASSDRYIVVPDVLSAMRSLARYHRRVLGIPVIAVTGTNGKTTTKELMRDVLSKKYRCVATEGNLNNHIGVPLTLLKLDSTVEMAIVEMGANHPGEIMASCRIAEPDFGLITNVGIAHLEGFGSEEGIRKTKGELYDWLEFTGGKAFYSYVDDKLLSMVSERSNLKTFAYHIYARPVDSKSGLVSFYWGKKVISTNFVGEVNLMNISAAIAVGTYFGVSEDDVLSAVSDYKPSNNRSQIIHTDRGNDVILDAYNANPSSMSLALENFRKIEAPNKSAILGQMNELGTMSRKLHEDILQKAIDIVGVDNLYLVGKEFYDIMPERSFLSLEQLQSINLTNRTILVKGSRSNSLEQLLPLL